MGIPTLIYCAAGNARLARTAIELGFVYGAQMPNTVYFAPEFIDQDWKRPDRARYMAALAKYRPRLATVLDWERDDQLSEVLSWASEAAQYVSEAVIIVPKVSAGIPRIPAAIGRIPVRLGYSVPTSYGGTELMLWEFARREVHLLGGSPQRQMELAGYLNVASLDGNYAQKMGNRYGQFFSPGTASYAKNRYWPLLREASGGERTAGDDIPYHAFRLSCINIRSAWRGCTATIRLANDRDIPAIKQIADGMKAELGFINSGALKERAGHFELYVAEYGHKDGSRDVAGFVSWHRRRDGVSVIYEVAVSPEHRGKHVGQALVDAVPSPTRLKCPAGSAANAFYERIGMINSETVAGARRRLNVWSRPAYHAMPDSIE